jgi:hypothetical protein
MSDNVDIHSEQPDCHYSAQTGGTELQTAEKSAFYLLCVIFDTTKLIFLRIR